MRQTIIAGNWKLNKTLKESLNLVNKLKRDLSQVTRCHIVICPVFTALADISDLLIDSNICLGAQDMFWEPSGAYTGEVSGTLLRDAGCQYVIIGHSERRQFFHETNETVNKKIRAALASGLIPIVCCGETLEERESDHMREVLKKHIEGAFLDLSEEEASKTVVAYEPVWAIGTGKVATPAQAEEAHGFIRGLIKDLYSSSLADKLPILYGGSVKKDNSRELLIQENVDGALVGGASLDAEQFSGIIKAAITIKVQS